MDMLTMLQRGMDAPILDKWDFYIDRRGNLRLKGEVYNDPLASGYHPFYNGSIIRTSQVVRFDSEVNLVLTESGTVYHLARRG